MKKTLVLGASSNPARYSYLAIRSLQRHGHEIAAIGAKEGGVDGVHILTGKPPMDDIDTVTLYMNPMRQEEYHDYLLSLKPSRIIFNPGTEHREFMRRAKAEGIEAFEACTLVMLSTGQF